VQGIEGVLILMTHPLGQRIGVVVVDRFMAACKLVSTRLYPTRVSVAACDVIVACHDRRANIGQIVHGRPRFAKLSVHDG